MDDRCATLTLIVGNMASGTRIARGLRPSARHSALIACAILFLPVDGLTLRAILADGCFVFKWNKKIDINEPTQKAIIVYAAGREDLLLQAKYEGPVDEFGWLIPVPSLPKVEEGSMQPFYELSQLTQREFDLGFREVAGAGPAKGRAHEAVDVIAVRTVGAYEVAILSAREAGSLTRWLRTHDYSIPAGRDGIIDDYIRKGWYFVAARIQLNGGVAFKMASGAFPKEPAAPAKTSKVIQRQLSSGELHPLLISFDTPQCIFPLRISAVGGKPSEVSVYVLSSEPLLDKVIFGGALAKLNQRQVIRDQGRPQRARSRQITMLNTRILYLGAQMYSLRPPGEQRAPDWSVQDLMTMAKEGLPAIPPDSLDDPSPAPQDLLQCLPVTSGRIPRCAKEMPRLRGKSWYLTKQVWTFRPEEMRDLAFQPAIPVAAAALPSPGGAFAAALLSRLGNGAIPFVVSACESTNATARINASSALGMLRDQRLAALLPALLKDQAPEVRLHAARGVARNWDPRLADSLIPLFSDPYPEIRVEAFVCLGFGDSPDRSSVYLELLKHPDPEVQGCALQVLWRMKTVVIPRENLLPLLGNSRIDTVTLALNLLEHGRPGTWPDQLWNQDSSTRPGAMTKELSSAEAAPLATNQFALARLMGLRILQRNADAKAIELTLSRLRDANPIVRNRAFAVLRKVTHQDISQADPAKWEVWWAANKAAFEALKPVQ
ncbi:MAG: DUF2330 domain-containing protein [Limisphaerales bacterium]